MLDSLRVKQEYIEKELLVKGGLCKILQQKREDKSGPRERRLLTILDEIKDVCQAYHGNVFVGNHCKLVLQHYELICSVVDSDVAIHSKFLEFF